MNFGHGMSQVILVVGLAIPPSSAIAQDYDGLYRPDEPWAEGWACDMNSLGSDGGAVGILNGQLHGVENTCDLTNPRAVTGGMLYTAICSAEGETYSSDYLIRATASGIALTHDGETVNWKHCGDPTSATGNTWVSGFAMGVTESSTEDTKGNKIIFSCTNGADGHLYVDLGGKPAQGGEIVFDVDGKTYDLSVWARGGEVDVECNVCAANYSALWDDVVAGNRLTVTQGSQKAEFSLSGSALALGSEKCIPTGW